MDIKHLPIFDTAKVEEFYTKKDGVDVMYVCTSAADQDASFAADIFYRAIPHPQFGNHYFGLYNWFNPTTEENQMMIGNADKIEDFEFGMIEGEGKYHYSQHRHDYKVVEDRMIDGGRSYIRSGAHTVIVFKVKDGKFIPSEAPLTNETQ